MKIEISRCYGAKLKKEQKEYLKKYNLEIKKRLEKHVYTKDTIEEDYYIIVNTIEQLYDIANELNEELIINKDGTILIYDDWIE